MMTRTLFNPIRLLVEGVEYPTFEQSYLDEDGKTQKVIYGIVNGEKISIQRRVELEDKIEEHKSLDAALVKVEEARVKKVDEKRIEDAKNAQPLDPIRP